MRTQRREDGAAAVEFALVAPLLLLIFFATIAFGMMFAQKLALGNGAREAARYGVVESRTCSQVTAAAQNAASTIGMSGSDVAVTIKRGNTTWAAATNACSGGGTTQPCKGSTVGDSLYVSVTFDGETAVPVPGIGDYSLEGLGIFRCEFS
jgi:Flp pilus assembly protein TadG